VAYADVPPRVDVPTRHTSTWLQKVWYVVGCAVAGAALGIPAGFIWITAADPPSAALTTDGVFFGETELNQQVGVTLWLLAVGVTLGLLAGLVVGWFGRRHGVVTVLAVLALCATATLVTYWTGVHLFGPADESTQLAGAQVGDQITRDLEVGTLVAHLGWPIGGLVGVLVAMFRWPQHRAVVPVLPTSSSVVAD